MRNGMHVNVLGALCMAVVLWGWGGTSAPESPVADAAMRGGIETVRALLREGADVNAAQG
ncbi:MAG: ankyrin repeat domain-containing protein, partial [Gemmatimonadetes bacterium]|nr:ankyrin repeat domain-containing protein [Gemmatimonadota bacterium]